MIGHNISPIYWHGPISNQLAIKTTCSYRKDYVFDMGPGRSKNTEKDAHGLPPLSMIPALYLG